MQWGARRVMHHKRAHAVQTLAQPVLLPPPAGHASSPCSSKKRSTSSAAMQPVDGDEGERGRPPAQSASAVAA